MYRCAHAMVLLLMALMPAAALAGGRIDRVEPASWWVGMKDDRLQLMVHGANVATLEPVVAYPGVSITGAERVASPNYLFVNLRIDPGTRPGRFALEFREQGRTRARYDYTLHARAPDSAGRKGFGPGDVIYLVTPDRFANGDPANDRAADMKEGPDRTRPFGRHGGDLAGIIEHLDYVAEMGFTQLWLMPVLENDQPETTYHGYAISDFYRVDPRFGSNEQYRQLAQEARKRGLGLVMDMVLNHCGSAHWWLRDSPAPDWFNHGGTFVATSHVHEALQDVHGSEADRRAFTDGWFVPTMPDMNQRNPFVATYLIQNSLWWVEYAGLSGIRVDTYPYSDKAFLTAWSKRLTEEYPHLNIVGEEWNGSPDVVAYWQRGARTHDGYVSYLPSLFDFPLQDAIAKGLVEREDGGSGLRRIYRVLAEDKVYADPYGLVVFHDNHDMTRMLSALGERQDLNRMALAITLTTRGIPQVFYGTEVLMNSPGEKNDGIIRSDFPGGWRGDVKNAFNGQGLSAAERSMQEYVRTLLRWRGGSSAIRDGKLTQFVPLDGVYVYFRHDAKQKVMVVVNNNDAPRTIDTGRFGEVIGAATTATDVVTMKSLPLASGVVAPARTATILELK
jgi:neopullulanase